VPRRRHRAVAGLGRPPPAGRNGSRPTCGLCGSNAPVTLARATSALALWHRLKLDELLAELLPAGRETVAWSQVAALLTVARFCAQRSELGVAEHWYDTTALDDLLGVDTRNWSTTTGSTARSISSASTRTRSAPT
jgi:hypothetical protein